MPRPKGIGARPFKKKCALAMTTSWYIANFYKLTPAQKFQASMVLVPKGISDKHEVKGNVSLGITIISPTKGTIKL